MKLEERGQALLEALEKYEKARDRGYYLEENPKFNLLAEEVRRTAASLQTVARPPGGEAGMMNDKTLIMTIRDGRPRWWWLPRLAWTWWPKTWGCEVQRPIYVRYRKWGPLGWRVGFYIKMDNTKLPLEVGEGERSEPEESSRC